MPIVSYNPSVFIQRIETTGDNATKEIVVNTLSTIKVADSINILGKDYLVQELKTDTKTIVLDKDRDANINLVDNATIEVRQNAPDSSVNLQQPTPISDVNRQEKILALGKDYYQRYLNKMQATLGSDYYQLKPFIDSETRSYLGTFNEDIAPMLAVFAKASSKTLEVVATEWKKKVVQCESEIQILRTQFINLSIKVAQAQSKEELDLIKFT